MEMEIGIDGIESLVQNFVWLGMEGNIKTIPFHCLFRINCVEMGKKL